MFIKKFDMLSPPITLYYKEEGQHSSIFSAILSIIAYTLVTIGGFYYGIQFINKESPKAYFFNRYVEDAGYFPLNSSSMFNFIQITDTRTNEEVPFDFSSFRAVGFDDVFSDEYMNNPNIIKEKDHWIYGYCNNNSDTEGIAHLINFSYYEQSACIRKYYDKNKKKYFNTGENGFRWPVIEKGCSNPERTYYGIIIQRCDEAPDLLKLQGVDCKSREEINDVINKVSLKYQLVDHYADMLNYKMPFTKYFYEVTSAITNDVYIVNHLNFNPANMLTHNGIFFDNQINERSYFFTQNEKHTVNVTPDQSLNGCLIGIYFWMQNTLQYYERNYDRLQDVLSDIGGISSIVVTLAYFINLLINNYVILLDTEECVLNTDKCNYQRGETFKKPTIMRKRKDILFPPKRVYGSTGRNNYAEDPQEQQSSNYQRLMKDGVDIYQNNNIKDEKAEQYMNIYLKRNNMLKNYYQNNKESKEGSTSANNPQNTRRIYSRRGLHYYNRKDYLENISNYKREKTFKNPNIENKENLDNNDSDNKYRIIEKQNFTWIKYVWFMITCGKSDKKIAYYETFRAKLISEENIIQNYLDIYKLLKLNNLPKKTLINSDFD